MFPYQTLSSDDWLAMRRDVLRRASHRCERCHSTSPDVYPRDGVSWDGASDALFVALCSRCLRRAKLRRAFAQLLGRLI